MTYTRQARRERAISRQEGMRLTATLSLSARVISCGGDGGLLGRGGEAFGGGATSLVAFFAFWKMGASFLICCSSAEDRPLLSLSAMVAV